MTGACEIRRCSECLTLFEACVADRHPSGAARCPQCGLASSTIAEAGPRDFVIRASTPFR